MQLVAIPLEIIDEQINLIDTQIKAFDPTSQYHYALAKLQTQLMEYKVQYSINLPVVSKEEFVDEFIDRIYMNGTKTDEGKYEISLSEATTAATELYKEHVAPNQLNFKS